MFKKKVIDKFNEVERQLNNPEFTADIELKEITNSEGDSLFLEILKANTGKVVYIDFWATWCLPCRNEMSWSKEIQQKFTGEKVEFVYLCCRSPEKSWKATISELGLKGTHYLLTPHQYDDLAEKFQIFSIPHYVLIDKSGKIVDRKAKKPSNGELVDQIRSLI
ncbi:MAG: TlpA family protein disulfide reductase [Candidatus Hodarchaeota archaeon]